MAAEAPGTAPQLPPAPALDVTGKTRTSQRRAAQVAVAAATAAAAGKDPNGLAWGMSRPRSGLNNDARSDGDTVQMAVSGPQGVVLADPIPLYVNGSAPAEQRDMDPNALAAAAAAVAEAQAAAVAAMATAGDVAPALDQSQVAVSAAQGAAAMAAPAVSAGLNAVMAALPQLGPNQIMLQLPEHMSAAEAAQQQLSLKPVSQIEAPVFTALAPRQLKTYTGKKPVLSTVIKDGITVYERDTVVTEAHCHLPLPKKFVRDNFPAVIDSSNAYPVQLQIVDDGVVQAGIVQGSIRPQSRKMAISPGIDVLAAHRGWKFCGVATDPENKELVRLYFDSTAADKYESSVGRKWARKYVDKAGAGGTGAAPGNAAAQAAAAVAAVAQAAGQPHLAEGLAAAAAAAMQAGAAMEQLMVAGADGAAPMAVDGSLPAAPARGRRGRTARVSHTEIPGGMTMPDGSVAVAGAVDTTGMDEQQAAMANQQQQAGGQVPSRVTIKRHGLANDGAAMADIEAAMAVSDAVDPVTLTMYPMQQGTYKAELRLPMQLVYQQLADLDWDGPARNVYAVVHEEGSNKAATAFPGYVKKYQNRRKARLMLGYTDFMNLYKGWMVEGVGMVGSNIVRLHMHRPKPGEQMGAPSEGGEGAVAGVEGVGAEVGGEGVDQAGDAAADGRPGRKRGRGRSATKVAAPSAEVAPGAAVPGVVHHGDVALSELAAAGQVRYLLAHPGGAGGEGGGEQWYAAQPLLAAGPGQEAVWQLQLLPISAQPGQEQHAGQQQLVLQAITHQDPSQVAEGGDNDPNKRPRLDYAPLTIAALQPGQVMDEHGQPMILWQQPLQEGMTAEGQAQAAAAGQLLQGADLQQALGLGYGAPLLLQPDGSARTWAGFLRDAAGDGGQPGGDDGGAAAAAAAAAAAGAAAGLTGAEGAAEAAAAADAAAGGAGSSAPLDAAALAASQQQQPMTLAYLPNGQLTALRQMPGGGWVDAWGRPLMEGLVRSGGDASAGGQPMEVVQGAPGQQSWEGIQIAQIGLQGQQAGLDLSQLGQVQLQATHGGEVQVLQAAGQQPGAHGLDLGGPGGAGVMQAAGDPHGAVTAAALHAAAAAAGLADAAQLAAAVEAAGVQQPTAEQAGDLMGAGLVLQQQQPAVDQDAAAAAAAAAAMASHQESLAAHPALAAADMQPAAEAVAAPAEGAAMAAAPPKQIEDVETEAVNALAELRQGGQDA